MKIERAQFTKENQTLPLENPWIRRGKINGRKASLWLDTGCTRSLVHPRCISREQSLGWEIPYSTASAREVWFPAARVTLQVGKTKQVLTVGVSPPLTVDMLIGRDVPQLTKWVAEKPPEEIEANLEDPPAVAQVATRAQRKRQDMKDQQDLEQQDLEQVRLSSPDQDPSGDESTSTVQPNLPRPLEQPPTPESKLMELGPPPPQALEENEGFPFAFSDEMFTREQPEPREETERPSALVAMECTTTLDPGPTIEEGLTSPPNSRMIWTTLSMNIEMFSVTSQDGRMSSSMSSTREMPPPSVSLRLGPLTVHTNFYEMKSKRCIDRA